MWLLTFSKQNPNGETESWNIIYESSNNNLLLQNVCLKRSQLGVDLIKKNRNTGILRLARCHRYVMKEIQV